MFEELDLDHIPDEYARSVIGRLLTATEELPAANRALQDENPRPRDEIARLKGTPGAPRFPSQRRGP